MKKLLCVSMILVTGQVWAQSDEPAPIKAPAFSQKMVLQPGTYGSLNVTNKSSASYFQMLTNSRNRVVIIPNENNSVTMLQSYYPITFLSLDASKPDFMIDNVQESSLSDYDKQYMKTKGEASPDSEPRYFRITTTTTAPGGMGVNKIAQVIRIYVPKGKNPGLSVVIGQGGIDIAV